MRSNWRLIAWILLGAVVMAAIVLMAWGKTIACLLHPEVFNLLSGLVFTTGVGSVGSLLLGAINAERERRNADRVLAREKLKDLVELYNEVKEIRRRLRAEAIHEYTKPGAYVLKAPYGDLLRRLNLAQLKLESHARLIEGNEERYPEPQRLKQCLKDAESYLGDIISEWEDLLGSFEVEETKNALSKFKKLDHFVDDAKHSFKPRFSAPIDQALEILGKFRGHASR